MSSEEKLSVVSTDSGTLDPEALGFALNFISGKGLLTLRERNVGPLYLDHLELEIPDIAFPFDVTGGAERFRSKHCDLRKLSLALRPKDIMGALTQDQLRKNGFESLDISDRAESLVVHGHFRIGDHHADFTFKLAPLLRSPSEVDLIVHSVRVFGWLPIPGCLIPTYLVRAIDSQVVSSKSAACWSMRPVGDFLRFLLPRYGWKIPRIEKCRLTEVGVHDGSLKLLAAPDSSSVAESDETKVPRHVVLAAEGIATFAHAESLLAQGELDRAFDAYRQAHDEGRGTPWVRERLFQIGSAMPELGKETRELALEEIARDPATMSARLALGAIAQSGENYGESAEHFAYVAELCRVEHERRDANAADLAAARAARPIDPAGALAAYERVAARARDSLPAHRALFELRVEQEDWSGATQAGERLLALETGSRRVANLHEELGTIYRAKLGDLKNARLQYEKALEAEPHHMKGLEGLSETYAARGEPARAASFLSRLAEQAEEAGEQQRAIALHLRLGEIWETWLKDPETAQNRYLHVLRLEPEHRTAKLNLARLAEASGQIARARSYYEDILAVAEEGADPETTATLVAAYTRLAELTLENEGNPRDAIASLERAVELDPGHRAAREALSRLLRRQADWPRLVKHLEESAQKSERRAASRYMMEAAEIELFQRRDLERAQSTLRRLITIDPDNLNALRLLIPILRDKGHTVQHLDCLRQAAQVTHEPEVRAEFFVELGDTLRRSNQAQEALAAYIGALQANPYEPTAGRQAVELAQSVQDDAALDEALRLAAMGAPGRANRAQYLVDRGELLIRRNKVDDGLDALRAALSLQSDRVETWLVYAQRLSEVRNAEAALESLELALSTLDKDRHAQIHEAKVQYAAASNRVDAQIEGLSALVDLGHGVEENGPRLSALLLQEDRADEVVSLVREGRLGAAEIASPALVEQTGNAYFRTGDYDSAQQQFEILLEKPDFADRAARTLLQIADIQEDKALKYRALQALLENAEGPERDAILQDLVATAIAFDASKAAQYVASLEEAGDDSDATRLRMAQYHEAVFAFDDALRLYEELLLEPKGDLDRNDQREAATRFISLAIELEPHRAEEITTRLSEEFPELGHDALHVSYGEHLQTTEQWRAFAGLRAQQIRDLGDAAPIRFKIELANALHQHLDHSEQALPFFQDAVAGRPDDTDARASLVEIYRRLERWEDLAATLFALSQLVGEPEMAFAYGIESVEVYDEQLNDPDRASQALISIAHIASGPEAETKLADHMRRLDQWPELAALWERSLGERPGAEDGRLRELTLILGQKIGQPDRAIEWCKRMLEAFPKSDDAWRTLVDLTIQHPHLGSQAQTLADWAEQRDGAMRAAILVELAELQHHAGDAEQCIKTLSRAAESDPQSETVIETLVTRLTGANLWTEALPWIERYARLSQPQHTDSRWRRLLEVSTDYVDEPEFAIMALESLDARDPDEQQLLVQLYIRTGKSEHLANLEVDIDTLDANALTVMARGVAAQGRLDLARGYIDRALSMGAGVQAWEVADSLWREAGKLAELGHWKLAYSENLPEEKARMLKLIACADLAESGDEASAQAIRENLANWVARLDLSEPQSAWVVFRAAQSIHDEGWVETAAQSLELNLPIDDPRLPSVLEHRFLTESSRGQMDVAEELARRLVGIDRDRGERLLQQVLEATEQQDELLVVLRERAKHYPQEANALYLQIAKILHQQGNLNESGEALQFVDEIERNAAWADLAYAVARSRQDADGQFEAAELRTRVSSEAPEKAFWLRTLGSLWWWSRDDEMRARVFLKEAQSLSPLGLEEVLHTAAERAEQGLSDHALQTLEEYLAVADNQEHDELWVALAEYAGQCGEFDRGQEAIDTLLKQSLQDATLLVRASEAAEDLGAIEQAEQLLTEAIKLNPELEDRLPAFFERHENWEHCVAALEKQGARLQGSAAAIRFERAGTLAAERLGQDEEALRLTERAIEAAPQSQNLRLALELARRLEQWDTVISYGERLLQDPALEGEMRFVVLRAMVATYESTGDAEAAVPYRTQLVEQGGATLDDKLAAADSLKLTDPNQAAVLYWEVAQETPEQLELYLAASACFIQANNKPQAAEALRMGLQLGLTAPQAFALGLQVFEGLERLQCIEHIIENGLDSEYASEDRHKLRIDLATHRMQAKDVEGAAQALQDARTHARSPEWFSLSEQALSSVGDQSSLADLWLDAARSEESPWNKEEVIERVQRAMVAYRELADTSRELDAAELLQSLDPNQHEARERVVELAAELGDLDTFVARMRERLNSISNAEEQAQVATRYATLLEQRFSDRTTASELLVEAFEAVPSLEIARRLDLLFEQLGKPEALLPLYQAGLDKLKGGERLDVALIAAKRAQELPDAEEQAFELYREVLLVDATNSDALRYCVAYAEGAERWTDAIGWLEQSAHIIADSGVRADLYNHAATLVREHAPNKEQELELMQGAADTGYSSPEFDDRQIVLGLETGQLSKAVAAWERGNLQEAKAVALGLKLVQHLREADDAESARPISQKLLKNYPDNPDLGALKLELAREENDYETLSGELARQLEDTTLDAKERAALHKEAASTARRTGSLKDALGHVQKAISLGTATPELLRDGYELARLLSDPALNEFLALGEERRAELEAAAALAGQDEQGLWLDFASAAAAWNDQTEEARRLTERALAATAWGDAEHLRDRLVELLSEAAAWSDLVAWHQRWSEQAESPSAKTDHLLLAGRIARDHLGAPELTMELLSHALRKNPASKEVKLGLGQAYFESGNYPKALELFEGSISPEDPDLPVTAVVQFAQALAAAGQHEKALEVAGKASVRAPNEHQLFSVRADVLGHLQRFDEAETELQRCLSALGANATREQVYAIRTRMGELSLVRRDFKSMTRFLEEASRAAHSAQDFAAIRDMYEKAELYERVAETRLKEAELASDNSDKVAHFVAVAHIQQEYMQDMQSAAAMLERAVELRHADEPLLRELLELYESLQDWPKYLVVGERLLSFVQQDNLDAPFFANMARSYKNAAGDLRRATDFFKIAAARDPENAEYRAEMVECARDSGDFEAYAEVQTNEIQALSAEDERIEKILQLADEQVQKAGNTEAALQILTDAAKEFPHDADLKRKLADTHALDARHYDTAASLYKELLASDPFDADVLRLLARLTGQLGDNDRAYGYYAALLALVPSDSEAKRFVVACRKAVPSGPQTTLSDADRAKGLMHPKQASVAESLFVPLARFAELTQPRNLQRHGITDQDQLAPTDPRVKWIQAVIEPLAIPTPAFYMWRGGGFACSLELGDSPSVLIGSTLASDATDRQRAFLVARITELFRTGHLLCEILDPAGLQSMMAALAKAVLPDAELPGFDAQASAWMETVSRPMTPAVQKQLTASAQRYVDAGAEFNIGEWRWSCLLSAGRLALLASCDVEEAVGAILRLRGFDDVTDDQRAAVLRESPEASDLFHFSTSDQFFELRESLGLALRRSK